MSFAWIRYFSTLSGISSQKGTLLQSIGPPEISVVRRYLTRPCFAALQVQPYCGREQISPNVVGAHPCGSSSLIRRLPEGRAGNLSDSCLQASERVGFWKFFGGYWAF